MGRSNTARGVQCGSLWSHLPCRAVARPTAEGKARELHSLWQWWVMAAEEAEHGSYVESIPVPLSSRDSTERRQERRSCSTAWWVPGQGREGSRRMPEV